MMLDPQKIKNLRALKGWTLKALADLAGVHYSLVHCVEYGKRNLTENVEQKLLKAFGIDNPQTLDRMLALYYILEQERKEVVS